MKRQNHVPKIHVPKINRRNFIKQSTVATAAMAGALPTLFQQRVKAATEKAGKRTPVILATDIGDDIDDTWALGFLLKCPELDLKLVLTDYGKPQYRANLLAKFLQVTGHTQVEVAVGPNAEPHGEGGQAAWVKDYDLKSYPGKVHTNGVQAVIDTIMHSKEQVTLIGIGPMPNVAATLAREPRITRHARFVGMVGCVRLGYARFVGSEGNFRPGNDSPTPPCAEWNVKAAPKAAQQVLSAPWDITITPLDTCGLVTLDGDRYARLLKSRDPIVTAIIENYRIWSRGHPDPKEADHHSSVLFDTVAVYLAVSHQLCKMERLGIRVSDDGFTLIDAHAKKMNVATGWNTLDGYRDFLVNRLLGS